MREFDRCSFQIGVESARVSPVQALPEPRPFLCLLKLFDLLQFSSGLHSAEVAFVHVKGGESRDQLVWAKKVRTAVQIQHHKGHFRLHLALTYRS